MITSRTIQVVAAAALTCAGATGSAQADDYRRSVPVEPGGLLEIRLDSGSVEVQVGDDDEIEVDAQGGGGWAGGSVRFELRSDGRDAEFRGENRGWLGFGGGNVRVRIRIPEDFSLNVSTGGGAIEIQDIGGDVHARTSGGRIEVDGGEGDVDLRTSGGPIRVDDVHGNLRARTSGGPIDIADVDGSVEARTSGGRIQAHDVGSPVTARTSGGSISVRFVGEAEGDLQTSGGSIEAELPEGAGVDLDATTSGGRVRMEDEMSLVGHVGHNSIKGELNGGGPRLRLKTSGGNVKLSLH